MGMCSPLRNKAHLSRYAFCFFWLLFWALPARADCPPDRVTEQVGVKRVIDGDTLILNDGRHLRLIGINTPELPHDHKPGEPGALAARQELTRLISQAGNKLAIRPGAETQDRYGRLLAHTFLPDGPSITASLLSQGLGFPVTIPPNTWQQGCYRRSAEQARTKRLGVWGMSYWQPLNAARLKRSTTGFRRVIGVVEHVGQSRQAIWLDFPGDFAVRIPRKDLAYFPDQNWNQWQGRRVEVSGWIYLAQGKPQMTIHHPGHLINIK